MNSMVANKSPIDLDKERVTCLLVINTQLMKKAISIYHNVLSNQQSLLQLNETTRQTIMELYQNCTRRIHCNLSVLTFLHEKYHGDPAQQPQNRPTFPIIVSAPQDMPELNQLYTKLQELYPEALQFLRMKIQQMRKQAQETQNTPQNQSMSPQNINPIPNKGIIPGNNPNMVINPVNYNPVNTSQQTINPNQNFNSNFNQGMIPSALQHPQGQGQAQNSNQIHNQNQNPPQNISPQQILQQMNSTQNSASASMMDFFN